MRLTRREIMHGVGTVALSTGLAPALPGASNAAADPANFDIDAAFADFMKAIGASPSDGGGTVTFMGRDPILRSRFRIGTSMALPAVAAAVGAAAIWKDRTGEGQDLRIDLREAVYNVNPILTPVMQHRLATGSVPPRRVRA